MNKVIYIEPDEEIISIIDRLKNVENKKVALVVPTAALLFSSVINLKLLKEEGKRLNKEISIVTSDSAGRNVASQVGFTVYETLGETREIFERDKEEQSKETPARRRIEETEKQKKLVSEEEGGYTDIKRETADSQSQTAKSEILKENAISIKKKDGFFKFIPNFRKLWIPGIIGIIVILFLLIFVFPHATVYINVYAEEKEVEIPFVLSAEERVVKTEKGTVIPALWESVDKEVSIIQQASGEKNIGDKASGTVTLYNRSGRIQLISAGSEFVTKEGKIFINPEEISVPGAIVSDFGELIPGKSSATLEAKEGGSDYNIGSTRFSIPSLGEMGSLVYGISEEPFSGGTDKQAKIVTKEDIETGIEKAQNEAEKKLEEEFGIKGDKVFVKGLAVMDVLSKETSKEEGDQSEEFEVKIKARFSFLSFDRNDFDKLFDKNINLQISEQKILVDEGYRSVRWEVYEFNPEIREAEVVGKATVLMATKINEDFLKSKITNLSIAELRSVLAEYPEIELTRVKFFPPLFITSLPANERNISIKIRYVEPSLSRGEWGFGRG